MPNRFIDETILWDDDVSALSVKAFSLYIRMIVIADDFGIIPAEPKVLANLSFFPMHNSQKFSEILRISEKLLERDLIREGIHNDQKVYVIKPDSWDRIQKWNIYKRTKSRYLKVCATEAQSFRAKVWPDRNRPFEKSSQKFSEILRNSAHARARAVSPPDNNTLSENSEEKEKSLDKCQPTVEAVNPVNHFPTDPVPETPDSIPARVIQLLHDLGTATGIREYQHISRISWEPKLHDLGNRIGYTCLLREAEQFCNWMTGLHETGKLPPNKKHNPRARFLNTWLGRVDTKDYTTGDSPHWSPPADQPSAYSNLMPAHP